MRLLLQRVSEAAVSSDGRELGSIGKGYCLFLCVMQGDTEAQADRLAEKVTAMRLFDGPEGKVNDRSLLDIGGSALVVSQFTLAADVGRGRRPDYTAAAPADAAQRLYDYFCDALRASGVTVATGTFGAYMSVRLENDGPVTLWLDVP